MKVWRSALVAGMVALSATLAGCGGGASAPSAGADTNANTSTAGVPRLSQVVRYGGLAFEVPSVWPVYDLDTDPNRCVRLDLHGVYLGHQHADPRCPTQQVGQTVVQVQPLDATTQARAAQATTSSVINGQQVRTDPHGAFNHEIVAVFPVQSLVVSITFPGDSSIADHIVQTFAPTP
jgi:hypothetical protein